MLNEKKASETVFLSRHVFYEIKSDSHSKSRKNVFVYDATYLDANTRNFLCMGDNNKILYNMTLCLMFKAKIYVRHERTCYCVWVKGVN